MIQPEKMQWHQFIVWYLLAVLALALGASIVLGVPPWLMKQEEYLYTGVFFGAFVLSALLPSIANIRSGRPGLVASAVLAILIFAIAYLALEQSGMVYRNRGALRAAGGMLLLTLLLLPFFRHGKVWQALRGALLAGVLLVWVLGLTGAVDLFRDMEGRDDKAFYQKTAYYNLKIRQHWKPFHSVYINGGGLATLGNKYLLGTGDGFLYLFDFDDSGDIEAQKLALRAPNNAAEFAADSPDGVSPGLFRVTGVAARQVENAQFEIYLSYHYWHADQQCFVLRVSRVTASMEELERESESLAWEPVYESSPCLSLAIAGSPFFGGHISGGKMVFPGDDKLLLSLGDHHIDGADGEMPLAQDPGVDYGKTILIDLTGGEARHFTVGHRNSQGLAVLENGEIWSLEHGPQGGDELNRLAEGEDYGWPSVTYGTDYGKMAWPLSAVQGQHEGYTKPIYSWVPSVATTALIQIKKPLFRLWQGDLLAATLHDGKIFRLRIEDQRVIVAEPFIVGGWSVRDVIEGHDGRLIVWSDTDKGVIRTIEPVLDGATVNNDPALVFALRCSGCHNIKDGKMHGIGPDLAGIVGRKMGAADGYQYSRAISDKGGKWTTEQLDDYLNDPQAFAPGNAMRIDPLSDADERAAVITYLQSQ